MFGENAFKGYWVASQLMLNERQDLNEEITYLQSLHFGRGIFGKRSDPRDDGARTISIVYHRRQDRLDISYGGGSSRDQPKRCVSVVNDRSEWLVNFMGDRTCYLAHGHHSRYMGELSVSRLPSSA